MANHTIEPQGEWAKERQLGSGACGTVSLWKNRKTSEEIAIKKCKLVETADQRRRWRTEVEMIKGMSHPNIVSYIKIPSVLENLYPINCSLGMEYCSMGDLRKFIAKTEHSCGLPEYHVRDLMRDIGSAIHYLHEMNNMHRDLKPENIVLKRRPDCPARLLYKITDLGYAKDLDITHGHTLVGTLQYLAPELMWEPKKNLCYNNEVDFWSFGLVVFECATGFRPFFHLSNSEPPLAVNLVKDKDDKDICAWHEGKGMKNVKFHDAIPEPHSLNPYFANDVSVWLRLMLCVDKKRRGGRDGREWFTMLTNTVLARKYIRVLNTTTLELQTYPLEESAVPHTLQKIIQSKTSVNDSDQLLLFGKGVVPDMTRKLMVQLQYLEPSSPENPIIYFFDKRPRQWPQYRNVVPVKIQEHRRNPEATTDHRRMVQIILHDILTKIKTAVHFCNAFLALVDRVYKVSSNLKVHLKEFIEVNCMTAGKIALFEKSLKQDMEEVDIQGDYSEICSGDDYKRECGLLQHDILSWKREIDEGKKLIQEADLELSKSRSCSDVTDVKESLERLKTDSLKFCQEFKTQHKRIEINIERQRNSAPADKKNRDKPLKSFCENQLRTFLDDNWSKTYSRLEEAFRPQSDLQKTMRRYIDDLMKLERVLFDIQDRKQKCSCIVSDLEEKQTRRQHMVWNMLKSMKEVYNLAHSYRPDANSVTELADRESGICRLLGTMMVDPDLQNVLNWTANVPSLEPGNLPHQPATSQRSALHAAPHSSNPSRFPGGVAFDSSQVGSGSHPPSSYATTDVELSSPSSANSISQFNRVSH